MQEIGTEVFVENVVREINMRASNGEETYASFESDHVNLEGIVFEGLLEDEEYWIFDKIQFFKCPMKLQLKKDHVLSVRENQEGHLYTIELCCVTIYID